MGKHIERVPLGFRHPTDSTGEYIPGAHAAKLSRTPKWARTAFQVYEDVSEGTPISPVFPGEAECKSWLLAQGFSAPAVRNFLILGTAPSVYHVNGQLLDGIESLADLTEAQARDIAAKYEYEGG